MAIIALAKFKCPQYSGQDPRGPGRVRAGGQRHQPDLHRALHPRAAGAGHLATQQPRPPQVKHQYSTVMFLAYSVIVKYYPRKVVEL